MKLKLKQLMGLLPSKLPIGASDFVKFCDDIFDTYGLPAELSYRRTIATMIMQLGPQVTHKPKDYFQRSIKHAMASQIAYEMVKAINKEEDELKKQKSTLPNETI